MKHFLFSATFTLLFCTGLLAQWTKPEPLETGVNLRIYAPIGPDGSQPLAITIATNDPYDCKGARFASDVTVSPKKVTVKIQGVSNPVPCPLDLKPVTETIDLSGLGPGEYPIRVTINRQFFKAKLTIADDHFALETDDDPELFRVANGRLNKVPKGAIWGHCSYSDPEKKARAEAFFAELKEAGATKFDLSPGDYGEFYIHFGGEPIEISTGPSEYDFPFIYKYSGSPKDFLDIVKRYRTEMKVSLRSHTEIL